MLAIKNWLLPSVSRVSSMPTKSASYSTNLLTFFEIATRGLRDLEMSTSSWLEWGDDMGAYKESKHISSINTVTIMIGLV